MGETYFPFEQLDVYTLSLDFAAEVYLLTKDFPDHERFGLTNQIRRAAVSVSLNIAEGRGRGSDRDFVRFLMISRGSLFEVVSATHIAHRLKYMDQQAIDTLGMVQFYGRS
jgi:four helix bundle protein